MATEPTNDGKPRIRYRQTDDHSMTAPQWAEEERRGLEDGRRLGFEEGRKRGWGDDYKAGAEVDHNAIPERWEITGSEPYLAAHEKGYIERFQKGAGLGREERRLWQIKRA